MLRTFPETTIISITTHGEIRLNNIINNISEIEYIDSIPTVLPTFEINNKISEFYKYNAVVPGVVNFVDSDDESEEPDKTKKFSCKKDDYEILLENDVATIHTNIREIILRNGGGGGGADIEPHSISSEIASSTQKFMDTMLVKITGLKKELEKKIKKNNLTEEDDCLLKYYTDFINNAAKGSSFINCLERGKRTMVNKTFVLLPENVSPTSEDWSITCLNYPFTMHRNIFDEIYSYYNDGVVGLSRRIVTMEQIVNYLADRGVVNLIVIDLTCSLIFGPYDDDPCIDDVQCGERTLRMLRRDVLGYIGYGGKIKTKKTRKNKKKITRKRKYRKYRK